MKLTTEYQSKRNEEVQYLRWFLHLIDEITTLLHIMSKNVRKFTQNKNSGQSSLFQVSCRHANLCKLDANLQTPKYGRAFSEPVWKI